MPMMFVSQMPLSHEQIADSIWACPLIHPTVTFKRDKILFAGNYQHQAIYQAQIGWNGCRMLNLPKWQYLAVMAPILRAIFPPGLSHLIYRSLAPFNPRKKEK
jgi:hypothetical protein